MKIRKIYIKRYAKNEIESRVREIEKTEILNKKKPHSRKNVRSSVLTMLNQIYDNRQKILLSILVFIVSLGGFLLLYSVFNPRFDVFTSLSGLSSYFVAILTVLYVLVTSNQLDLMAKQLDEMKKGRELQNQPFPLINLIEMKLEKPRYYTLPFTRKRNAMSRYWIDIVVKNIGSSPAVCLQALAILTIPSEKETIVYKSITGSIAALDEKSKSSLNEEKSKQRLSKEDILSLRSSFDDNGIFSFLFLDDNNGMLLKSIVEGTYYTYSKLTIKILYKNVLGGCFELRNEYRMLAKSESTQNQTFENWSNQLILSDTNFHDELQELDLADDYSEWRKLLEQLDKKFKEPLIGNDFEELDIVPINGTFSIKPISEKEYNEILKEISMELEKLLSTK
jgi:hypothetical protein